MKTIFIAFMNCESEAGLKALAMAQPIFQRAGSAFYIISDDPQASEFAEDTALEMIANRMSAESNSKFTKYPSVKSKTYAIVDERFDADKLNKKTWS